MHHVLTCLSDDSATRVVMFWNMDCNTSAEGCASAIPAAVVSASDSCRCCGACLLSRSSRNSDRLVSRICSASQLTYSSDKKIGCSQIKSSGHRSLQKGASCSHSVSRYRGGKQYEEERRRGRSPKGCHVYRPSSLQQLNTPPHPLLRSVPEG